MQFSKETKLEMSSKLQVQSILRLETFCIMLPTSILLSWSGPKLNTKENKDSCNSEKSLLLRFCEKILLKGKMKDLWSQRAFLFLSKRKTLQNFYDSFCKNKERFQNVCFIFKHEIWFKSMVYEVSVEIISEKNKNNFVVAEFFLSRMCFLKMSKTRILKFWLFTRRFESGCSQI